MAEAIEKNDEARFDLASNKLIALLYAKKSNEVHKRVGEILVQFDIQWALPVMVECVDQTESIWTRSMPKEFPLATAVVAFGRSAVPASWRRCPVAKEVRIGPACRGQSWSGSLEPKKPQNS